MSESEIDTGVIQGTDTGKISEIAELIRSESAAPSAEKETGETDPPPAPGEQPPAPDDEPEKPAIDYDLVIPISASDGDSEGESRTIAQLKDHYQANKSLESDREAWETTQREQENEAMVVRVHLNALAEQLGGVAPEILQKAQQNMALNAEHEAKLLLQVKPEWADPAVKKIASAAMLETIVEYGYNEQQYMAINDHRQIKILHDLATFRAQARAGREKLEKAADLAKAQKPARIVKKSTSSDNAIKRAASGTQADKIGAISSVIDEALSNDSH